jgi:hypothetical protein
MNKNFAPLPSPFDLLNSAWQIVRTKARVLYTLMLLLCIPALLGIIFSIVGALARQSTPAQNMMVGPNPIGSMFIILGFLVIVLIVVAFSFWVQLAMYAAVIYDVDFRGAFRAIKGRLNAFVWVSILVALICALGYILLIIPGIIFSIWYSFATMVFLVENLHGMQALRQSKHYVSGRWWAVLGRIAFMFLIYVVGLIVVALLPGVVKSIFSFGLAFAFSPLAFAYWYSLYYHMRQTMPENQPAAPAVAPQVAS